MAGYKNDEELKNGKQAGQTVQPGTQDGQWKDQLDDTIDKILNREQFSYDMDSDAMFEQMKDQYIRQGQMAAMDTMGRAATMTGGYGNSYAQGVGQQAYQEYLQGFNDTVPDLYQMALDAYTREGQALGDKYAVLTDKRGDELEAAELAASLGDYSLLAKYYGWTDEYMDGLVNPERGIGTGGNPAPTYKNLEIGSDMYNDLMSRIENATSLEELNGITSEYVYYNYNPADIYNSWAFRQKKSELSPKNDPVDTTVDNTFMYRNAGGVGAPVTVDDLKKQIEQDDFYRQRNKDWATFGLTK